MGTVECAVRTEATEKVKNEEGSIWKKVPTAPADPILGLNAMFQEDSSDVKVNLGVGAYRTAGGKPYVLPVVKRVERALAEDETQNHEYLPIAGHAEFIRQTAGLILGKESEALRDGRVATVQALSGTGALRVGFTFLRKFYNSEAAVLIPRPTWANHKNVIAESGLGNAREYRYFDSVSGGVDIEGMIEDLKAAPMRSVVLLHGCAHNPTGADPTEEQWKVVKRVCEERKHLPFFDVAYQGFATGDLHQDGQSVRLFAQGGSELIVSQSYAKNMGLYGERIGALNFVCSNSEVTSSVLSQLKRVIRPMYSNPPAHGAKIAARILSDGRFFEEWEGELRKMSGRIQEMRHALRKKLEELKTPGSWDRITRQIGMFSYTGLTEQQVEYIRKKHHVYMTSNGRISMAGLNVSNVDFVARAISDAIAHVHTTNKL